MKFDKILDSLTNNTNIYSNLLAHHFLNIVSFTTVIIFGFLITMIFSRMLSVFLRKTSIEKNIILFVTKTFRIIFYLFSFFVALETIGIDTSSIAGVLGTSTIAAGIAVRDQVGNAISGLILTFTKHLNVGDRVEIDGKFFNIAKIDIFTTTLTMKNRKIIMPNKKILGDKQVVELDNDGDSTDFWSKEDEAKFNKLTKRLKE